MVELGRRVFDLADESPGEFLLFAMEGCEKAIRIVIKFLQRLRYGGMVLGRNSVCRVIEDVSGHLAHEILARKAEADRVNKSQNQSIAQPEETDGKSQADGRLPRIALSFDQSLPKAGAQ